MEKGDVRRVRPYIIMGEISPGKRIWRPAPLSWGADGRVDAGKGSRERGLVQLRE